MFNSKHHIVVIGAGKLGSRYLQGLAKTKQDVNITVIEPNPDAMEVAKKCYIEMPDNPLVHSVRYLESVDEVDMDIDLSIIATTADVRRSVLESLLSRVNVKYFILEKVAFQSVKDFEFVVSSLTEKHGKAWVNCPRRMVPFFQELRKKTNHDDRISFRVTGSMWGLASNAIHMLDLFAFITGRDKLTIDVSGLDNEIYASKRPGFIELGGKLIAKTENGDVLEMIDDREANLPLLMHIETNDEIVDINQTVNLCRIFSRNIHKEAVEIPFIIPPQSELTSKQTEQILEEGISELTSLEESFLLHKQMLDAFNGHLSFLHNQPVTVCPIT